MRVSAVIPTKNRPVDLLRAVDSVLKQKVMPEELLVIDQSDTEASKDAVFELFNGLPNVPTLIYVYDPTIAGLIAAKAEAVARSIGDIIMFLEDDIVLEPEYVGNLTQGFIDDGEMMGASGVITEVAGTGSFYRSMFRLFHRGIFFDKRIDIHGHITTAEKTEKRLIQSTYLSGGVSAYRRIVFERVKFDLDNNFFMLEDIDFSTRAAREFGPEHFFINTSARLAHLMSPINRTRLGFRYRRKLREFVCFYKKNSSEPGALPALIWLLIGMLIEAMVISAKSRHVGPIFGFFHGLADGIRWKIISADTADVV